jgi:hypothetical protein
MNGTGGAGVELRIRGERAVLAGVGDAGAQEIDPHNLALGPELADALHEWARVAAAVRRAGQNRSDQAGAGGTVASGAEAAVVVSQRGRQLAARVAAVMDTPVRYLDPVTQTKIVIPPPVKEETAQTGPTITERVFGAPEPGGEPTPWLTGLTVAAFVGVVIVVAMLALAGTLARETSGWLTLLASAVVTAGLAPSLWLARKLPILRWAALGAAVGVGVSWVGVLFLAL